MRVTLRSLLKSLEEVKYSEELFRQYKRGLEVLFRQIIVYLLCNWKRNIVYFGNKQKLSSLLEFTDLK